MSDILVFIQANTSLVTLLVGLAAFAVYSQQKWDKKRNAANAIFIEIKTAEDNLSQAKSLLNEPGGGSIPDDIFLLPVESWSSNRQDFIKDFRTDEWKAIDNFYGKCKLYDENARYNAQAFSKNEEQIRINAHRLVADYADELTKKVAQLNEEPSLNNEQSKTVAEAYKIFSNKESFIEKHYLSSNLSKPMYTPQKYLDRARSYAAEIDTLSLSSVGKKLNSISKRSWIRNILHLYSNN